jgi:hypothetical protein
MKKQRANESADNWLSEFRQPAIKCGFFEDCCLKFQPTRILGHIVYGVYDDDVRRKLLEQGDEFKLDEAIDILRVLKTASTQAKILKNGDVLAIQALLKSSYKKDKLTTRLNLSTNSRRRHFNQVNRKRTRSLLNSTPLLKVAGTVVVKPDTSAQSALLMEKTAGNAENRTL